MSFRAIVEVAVHFESFRNIDLCKQGTYFIQVQVFHTVNEKVFRAAPHICHVKGSPRWSVVEKDSGEIDDFYYNSQSFMIKYCDEEIDINEIAVFRTEIDAYTGGVVPELTVLCSLNYSIITGKRSYISEFSSFETEAVSEVKVRNCLYGVNQFVPITFDDTHCCVINSTIHAIPIEFRFRPRPMLTSIEENSLSGLKTEEENFNIPNSLTEIFFEGQYLIDQPLLNRVQQKYVKLLHNVYKKNIKLLQEWNKIIIDDNNKNNNELLVQDPQIEDLAEMEIIHEDNAIIATEMILCQIQKIAEKLNLLEFEMIETLQKSPTKICYAMMLQYNEILKDQLGESIFRTVSQCDNFCVLGKEKTAQDHKKIAKKIRKSEYYRNIDPLPVIVKGLFPYSNFHPIIFLDISSKVPENKLLWNNEWVSYMSNPHKAIHLIVFVHGFQGSSFDLRLIRNHAAMCRSNTFLLCSSKNESHTEGDISGMGLRLAKEVERYIRDWCPDGQVDKISFIGHSLGGIIIRAALPYLQSLSNKFQFLITFSTPHLGYMYNSSALVDAGMWFIKKWRKSLCMKQLSMSDASSPIDSFLYGLSLAEGIQWFKHIAFVSSIQDNYAPFESARIEVGPKAIDDSKGRIYIEMANNILSRVTAEKIHRIDVNFKLEKKGIDSMIGRAAHIQMLDNRALINMVLHCCASFFGE